jgi:hypothetical protein
VGCYVGTQSPQPLSDRGLREGRQVAAGSLAKTPVAGVDAEQRTVALGMLHERTRDTIVMLHDKTENPVDMVKVVKGGPRISAVPIPDDWKPLAAWCPLN